LRSESFRPVRLRHSVEHSRVRERYIALYLLAQGKDAKDIAPDIGKNRIAVANWCRLYNEQGPETLHPDWAGTHPDLSEDEFVQLKQALLKHPRESGFSQAHLFIGAET